MVSFLDKNTSAIIIISGVPRKKCSEDLLQIYRRTPMPKCDFNKVAL